VKTTWYLMSGGLLAALGQGAVPVITYARRVGATFPTALLGQACLLDRTGPLSVASHGPLLHGCASLPVPDVRPVLAWRALRALLPRDGKRELRACGRAVWEGVPGARALLTGLDPHPAPTPPTIQYTSPVPATLSNSHCA
jgi:hypothetical protein